MTRTENYCRLLGLNPLKENRYSSDSISATIDEKERKWMEDSRDRQNDVGRRFKSQSYIDAIPDMRLVMGDDALRRKEFDDALELLTAKASRLKKDSVILHDGTPVRVSGAAETLVKKLRWDGICTEDLVSLSGVKEYDPSYLATDTVLTAYNALATVGAFTPSEMLNDLVSKKGLEIETAELSDSSPAEDIRDIFDLCERRVNSVRSEILPEQDSYIQAMRAVKLAVKSDDLLYELTQYGMCQRALIPIFDIIEDEYTQPQNRAYVDELMSIYLTDPDIDMDLAIRAVEDYCIRKKFIINFSETDSIMIRCPSCKAFVETGNDIICCSVCGHKIKTICPRCNTKQHSVNRACVKCGFDMKAGRDKALEMENSISEMSSAGLLSDAKRMLDDLKNEYSTYMGIDDLERNISATMNIISSEKKEIEQSYRLKRYSGTVELVRDVIARYRNLMDEDPSLKKIYDNSRRHLDEADSLFDRAEKETDAGARMDLYISAAEVCPDHAKVGSALSGYAPAPPADAEAKVSEGKALIKYSVPEERNNVTFCIYREKNSLPCVEYSAVPLAEVETGYYLDETAEPGVEYYYRVRSKRWGVLSEESASCGPVTVFAEAQNISVDPLEDGLRLYFEKPENCSRVRIWRKRGSEGEEVEVEGEGPAIEDRGLSGGDMYHYLFVAEYESPDGRVNRSSGTVHSGTTPILPDPIKDLNVNWNKSDGTFTAEWTGNEDVVLCSSSKSIRMYGLLIKLEDMDSWMTRIDPIEKKKGRIRFSMPEGAIQYIYPMIPVGRYAVRGLEVLVADLKPFRDVSRNFMGGDCILTMSWPQGAESAVLIITDSGNPAKGPDDLNGERITISAEAYTKDKMIKVSMSGRTRRAATVFAVYDADGKKMTSRGMSFDMASGTCRTIKYRAEAGRSKDGNIVVAMDTDKEIELIPPIVAVYTDEGIPLRRNEGRIIWRSEVPMKLNKGHTVFKIEARQDTDLSHMRIFFENDEDYSEFKFIHPLYGGR